MELKCPYCPEIRPSRSRLVTHMSLTHLDVSPMQRAVDAQGARTVEDVTVTSPALTIETSDTVHVVQCVCGTPIEPMDEDTTYPDWTHVYGVSTGKCKDAIPAAGMPTKADRAELNGRLSIVGAGLAEAGREMAEMRVALDAVDARMAKLDAQLTSPATVRRATLNQVWDRLLDVGDLAGAAIVMKMISAVVDDA